MRFVYFRLLLEKVISGAGEMPPSLREHVGGLERWLSGTEYWLIFQRTWVRVPEPMWQLTAIFNSSSRMICCSLLAAMGTEYILGTYILYAHMYNTLIHI